MIPFAEEIVSTYLRQHENVEALDARVAGQTPPNQSRPWVRVTLLDAANVSSTAQAEHLVDFMLQLDCYAGKVATEAHEGQAEASLLARTVRAALVEMPGADLDAIVTSVTFSGMARIPDPSFEPARERVVLTASVVAHP